MSAPQEAGGWEAAWQPLVDCLGQDFSDGEVAWGADPVEAGGIRRYLEPLEFDCALHHDRQAAQAMGHADVLAPCASLMTWSLPAQWTPGRRLFDEPGRNARPAYSPLTGVRPAQAPPTTGFFATEFDADFLLPVVAGDHIGRRASRLLACRPRQTAVGRGAFLTWEYDIVNQRLALVAQVRMTLFYFNPLTA